MQRTALIVAALALCAFAKPSEAEKEALRADAQRDVICEGPDDCEVKWGRALQWVLDNNAFRIQVQTAEMIQTAGPLPNDPRLAVTVVKLPLGGGRYRLQLRGGCDNMFGCVPKKDLVGGYYYRAVMQGQAGRQF